MPTIQDKITQYSNAYNRGEDTKPNSARITSTKPSASATKLQTVSPSTFKNLFIADKVAKAVNSMLDKGNQLSDVRASRFGSSDRVDYLRNNYLDPIDSRLCAGNCGEHADMTGRVLSAMKSRGDFQKQDQPLVWAEWSGDHDFLLIGDPREKKASRVAVVDGWVTQPSAHTLDNNFFEQSREHSMIYSSLASDEAPAYLDKKVEKMTEEEFEQLSFQRVMTQQERDEDFSHKTENLRKTPNYERCYWESNHAEADRGGVVKVYKEKGSESKVSFNYNLSETAGESLGRERRAAGWPGN